MVTTIELSQYAEITYQCNQYYQTFIYLKHL